MNTKIIVNTKNLVAALEQVEKIINTNHLTIFCGVRLSRLRTEK